MYWTRQTLMVCVLATSIALPGSSLMAAESRTARTTVGIDNFGQIDPTYFRGAQPEESDYTALAAFGIKTVIDLQADGRSDEQRLVEKAGMTFHRIPMTTRVVPTAAQIEAFLALVNDPANQPVYVHCAGGRHRTGVMTAIYRMTEDGWTSEQAFKEMKKYKFGADFLHPEFKKFVYAFQPQPAPTVVPRVIAAAVTTH